MNIITSDISKKTALSLPRRLTVLLCAVLLFMLPLAGCLDWSKKKSSLKIKQAGVPDSDRYITAINSLSAKVQSLKSEDKKNDEPDNTEDSVTFPHYSETDASISKHIADSAQSPQANYSTQLETPVRSSTKILSVPNKAEATENRESFESAVRLPKLADPKLADELISLNFDQMDIREVLRTIGDITGINFVIDDKVQGTVTVISPTKIRLGEIYELLQSILEVKGYAAVPAGNLVKIVPRTEAAKHNLTVRVGGNPSEIPQSDSIVTQIIPLRYADAAEVSQIIRPLLGNGSQMSTYPRTNSILITDTSSNISHVSRIIQQLDRMGSEEQVMVIGLTYASAEVVCEHITEIMEKDSSLSSQANRNRPAAGLKPQVRILPDRRTNSLIVVANAHDAEIIKAMAEQLDIDRPRGNNNAHVVYLKNAPAKETAQSLSAALANLRITGDTGSSVAQQVNIAADEGTNALIITASAQDFQVVRDIIEKLDIVRESVLVEMLILEVSQDSLKEIGVDWATLDEAVSGSVRFFGATNFGLREAFATGDLEGLAIGAWKKNDSTTTIGPIIHALEKVSGVNILSTPHILTSNHQKARIVVGENRPFVMQSRITETDPSTPTVIKTFEYKDVGITLEIVPHISQGGLVRLEIESEFTKLVETVSTSLSETPTTAKRQAQTVVSMNSGSTVVIGGLIRDDKVTIHRKVPLVGDIPLVGQLFRQQKDQVQKTNLLIFITPYIVSGQQDLDKLTARKKQEMDSAVKDIDEEKAGFDEK